MAESNPEETFTFVDKRKVGAESGAETEGVTVDADAAVSSETAAPPVDLEYESEFSDEELAAEDDAADSIGSYGLAAYVTGLIASDAWQKMGLTSDPATGRIGQDFAQARFSIDCVAALVGVIEQYQAAIPGELRRDLQRVLNDLRLNFIEQQSRA